MGRGGRRQAGRARGRPPDLSRAASEHAPQAANPPFPLAVVLVDGGRLQTRQPGHGPGVHGSAWWERKTALFLRMTRESPGSDPQPRLPTCFARSRAEALIEPESEPPDNHPSPQTILLRTGLATLENSDDFGWQAAEERGFFSSASKAYVCDGQADNGTIHRRHFGDFEPILDFVHAAKHLHTAALAAGLHPVDDGPSSGHGGSFHGARTGSGMRTSMVSQLWFGATGFQVQMAR